MKNIINDTCNLSINNIGLNPNLAQKLITFNIRTVRDLIKYSINDLYIITKLGERSINSIVSIVTSLGLEFNESDQINFTVCQESLISVLNLDSRILNALNRSGIKTIKDLTSLNPQELITIDNINTISITKIYDTLSKLGIELQNDKNIENESSIFILDIDFSIRKKFAYNGIRTIRDLISLSKRDLYMFFNNNINLINQIYTIIHDLGFYFEEEKDNSFITLESSIFILDIDFSIRKKLASRGIKTIKDFSNLEVNSDKLVDFSVLEKNIISESFIFLGNYFNKNNSFIQKDTIQNDYDAIINCLKQNNPELVTIFENIFKYGEELEKENNRLNSIIAEMSYVINSLPTNSVNKELFSKKRNRRN